MKVINSRGRVLLEVTNATAHSVPLDRVLYSYRGEGCGGYVDLCGLHHAIETIKADAPSARVIGELPEPTISDARGLAWEKY